MPEKNQEIVDKYAKEEWKDDPENVIVALARSAEGVANQLEYLENMGYDVDKKVQVIFPKGYTVEDLEANKPEPDGAKWYILAHRTKSLKERLQRKL